MRGYLRRNHRTALPGAVVCVDTETAPVPHPDRPAWKVHKLRLGVAVYFRLESGRQRSREVFHFTSTDAFWAWLTSKLNTRRPLWLFAHNLFFDLSALRFWEQMESGAYTLTEPDSLYRPRARRRREEPRRRGLLATEDPPSIWDGWHSSGARLRCLDTMNWWRCGLADLGWSLGLEKLPMPAICAAEGDWFQYCLRDVEIVEKAVLRLTTWVKEHDLGNFRVSAASQSFAAFRHRFMPDGLGIFTPDTAKPLERRAYYPARQFVHFVGRVVPFEAAAFRGSKREGPAEQGPVYALDVSSCYPSVMAGHDYPTRHVRTLSAMSPKECLEWMEVYAACAECHVDTEDEPYPYRESAEEGGRVLWCVGRFATVLCGPELRRGLESGHVTALGLVQFYVKGRPFDAFVEWVLSQRAAAQLAGDQVAADLAKLVGNSLHGKFGQRSPRWEVIPGLVAPTPWGHFYRSDELFETVHAYRSVAYTVQRSGDGAEADNSFPLIAAYATAYARERMRVYRRAAGKRQVFMEDCDTLHVTHAGYRALIDAGHVGDARPGLLRLENCQEEAEYRGVRNYRLGDDWTIAGLTLKARQLPDGRWVQSTFAGPDATISGGPLAGPLEMEQLARDPLPYVPGQVRPDGWVAYFERGLPCGRSRPRVVSSLRQDDDDSGTGPV